MQTDTVSIRNQRDVPARRRAADESLRLEREYAVPGAGDFNGDAKADILLRDATGTYRMWLMNGTTISTGALIGAAGPSYMAY